MVRPVLTGAAMLIEHARPTRGLMSRIETFQRAIRSRTMRLAFAASLVIAGLWEFLPSLSYQTAPSAFVNAELMRIVAPIGGRVSQDLPRKGDFIASAEKLRLIETFAEDQRHLRDLVTQQAVAQERAELARKHLAEIAAADAELDKRVRIYRDGVTARLTHERDQTQAEINGCRAEAAERRGIQSRLEQLVKNGTVDSIRSAEALTVEQATATRCEMAAERLKQLQVELNSADQGVFLRDGSNDAPYSQQQRDRLLLQRQELNTKFLEATVQAKQLSAAIDQERDRLNRVNQFDISLPADHVVWSATASRGSTVSEGQTLLDLADCGRRFVSVELPERDFESMKPGAVAFVRLIGNGEWRKGVIQQVRGSAARNDDRLLASEVKRPEPNSITVEIALPKNSDPVSHNNFCNIGRLAEVRFPRSIFPSLRIGAFAGH